MTDKALIARLREMDGWVMHGARTHLAAADRIEALSISNATLIAERDALQAWKRYWSGEYDTVLAGRADEYTRAEAAEAKLAENEARLRKAVEAGQTMDDGCDCERCSKARATLAEIKSGVATTPYGLEGDSHE